MTPAKLSKALLCFTMIQPSLHAPWTKPPSLIGKPAKPKRQTVSRASCANVIRITSAGEPLKTCVQRRVLSRSSRDGPRLTRFGFVYGASTFTPCASKSKTLPRSSYSPGGGSSRVRPNAKVAHTSKKPSGTQISVATPLGGNGWQLPQSSDPPIPMRRGVCIATTASANVGTRGIWASPALLLAPSAFSQKVMVFLLINGLGRS